MSRRNRRWMYKKFKRDGSYNPEFLVGVDRFVQAAFKHRPTVMVRGGKEMIRCPCNVCDNTKFLTADEVSKHLCMKGFTRYYHCWHKHGETKVRKGSRVSDDEVSEEGEEISRMNEVNEEGGKMSRMNEMVLDAAGPEFNWDATESAPNPNAEEFYKMLEAADKPLWELGPSETSVKCKESLLSVVSELLVLKSDFQLPRECFNRLTSIIKKVTPENDLLPPNFYEAKKVLRGLGLKYQKIDVCPNDCMLYYKDRETKEKCDICGEPRYKIDKRKKKGKPIARKILRYLPLTPRLQRLYMSPATAEHMRWHKNGIRENVGVMIHPSDGEAWKSFDRSNPDFACEVRNVRLGLATDGFTPFGMGAPGYSSWPLFIAPYNLPPGIAMKSENIFLTLVIPGPKSPGRDLDIFLEPLVDELMKLWDTGVETFDFFSKQNFRMKAALLWTISDFPAYGMLSGWCTHGRLACPICMGFTNAFRLRKGRKATWFDHRIFLPSRHRFRANKKNFKKNIHMLAYQIELL